MKISMTVIDIGEKPMTTSLDAGKSLNAILICLKKKHTQRTNQLQQALDWRVLSWPDNGYLANRIF